MYSHHATDPCSNKLVNAFDLVRLHKYGDQDDGVAENTPVNRLPSYKAMREYANSLDDVALEMLKTRQEQAAEEFAGLVNGTGAGEATPTDDGTWLLALERNQQTGSFKGTQENFRIILEHDPRLRDRIWTDGFADRVYGLAPLPWGSRRTDHKRFIWSDADDAGLRGFFEKAYKIDNKSKLDAALMEHLQQHTQNPVQDYLNGLKWDGKPRLDTLLIDYLGAEDCKYVRAVTRKAFVAAVARAMVPGCKFDNMLILCGPQGVGKSTLLSLMAEAPQCDGLFNDSIRTFEGKEAAELLQGIWMIEIAELNAFRGSDVDRIKQFLSLRADTYRAAYAHRTAQRPRTCVFFGTCNTFDFLRDPTGNRRFWPVDVAAGGWTEEKQSRLIAERDQIWAEARMRYITGERLFLTGDVEATAKLKQEAHMENDPLEGRIAEFLERPIPADWDSYDFSKRLTFWGGGLKDGGSLQLIQRNKVCAAEILKELFNLSDAVIDKRRGKEVNSILQHLGWKPIGYPDKFGPHGKQRGYLRPRTLPTNL